MQDKNCPYYAHVLSAVHAAEQTCLPCNTCSSKQIGLLHRRAQPAWRQLLCSQDFRAIASLNAVMFATTNGARSMLMPLLAVQRFGMSATSLGEPACFA